MFCKYFIFKYIYLYTIYVLYFVCVYYIYKIYLIIMTMWKLSDRYKMFIILTSLLFFILQIF